MKNGLRWLDSDMHMAEPWDLWQRYIEPEFRDRLRALNGIGEGYNPLTHGPADAIREIRKTRVGMFDNYLSPDRTHVDPAGQLRAMDREGIDAAVLFPTIALRPPADNPPGAAIAVRRAFNSWLHEFCAYEPSRLKLNAAIPTHDVDAAVAEIRRAKTELGAGSGVLGPRGGGAAFGAPPHQ